MSLFQTILFWFFVFLPVILFLIALARTSWVMIIVSLLFALPLVFFVSWITDHYGAVIVVLVFHIVTGVWLWTKRQRLDF
ncbi:hypothetical protein [Fictibacillus barbaricus]|uniref:Thiol:disulfide interchange protein n=1 Tax=Fictibacillus barbaricus TaxID=182136 RepID=A0ABU1TWY0_9BACL|nr:hypothetical protein [Fictibacillus barbaricus]MDR7071732.1 thiol:disulfide interchange protein [Fictibacillus barbaricus]